MMKDEKNGIKEKLRLNERQPLKNEKSNDYFYTLFIINLLFLLLLTFFRLKTSPNPDPDLGIFPGGSFLKK